MAAGYTVDDEPRIHLVPRHGGSDADARDQNTAVRSDRPFIGDQENDPAREATQRDGLNDVRAGEMNLASEPMPYQEAVVQPLSVPISASADEEKHCRWVVSHQRAEIYYLDARTEELERQVRRRTIMLAVAVVFAVLSAVTASLIAIMHLTEVPSADQVRAAVSSPLMQADPARPARNSGRPLSSEPLIVPPGSSEASEAATGPAEVNRARDTSSQGILGRNQQIAALERDLAGARHAADQARDKADQLTHRVQELIGARANLEQQLTQSSQVGAQAAQELQARAEHIAALERDAEMKEQKLVERAAEIDRLTSELRATTEARDKLETYAAERTRLLEQAGQDLRASADRVQALERELGLVQQQVGATQKQFDERRTALEQQLASIASKRDQATKALEARDQRIASLESELVLAREAAERNRAGAQRLAAAARDTAELRSTATWQDLRLTAREPVPIGPADGWRKTVLASDIFIVPGSDQLAARASIPLGQVAQLIRQSTGAVRIIGHMDSTGDADANRLLSLRRAQAVRDYLVSSYGFDPARFTVEGKGSDEPLAPNDTASGRHANRRVELFIAG